MTMVLWQQANKQRTRLRTPRRPHRRPEGKQSMASFAVKMRMSLHRLVYLYTVQVVDDT